MKEAMTRVRRDLGGDAVILSAREVRRRRLFGLGPRSSVEVTASDTMPADAAANREGRGVPKVISSIEGHAAQAPSGMHVQFGEELGKLHAMVESLSRHGHIEHLLPDLPGALVPTYSQLIEADVPEVLCRRLVQFVADALEPEDLAHPDMIRAALSTAVEECIPVAPPIRPVAGTRRIVALVGPTGVGKTTTVAKLAATLKLAQGGALG